MNTDTCPVCNGPVVVESRMITYEYKGATITLPQPGHYCSVCNEGYLDPVQARANEREFRAFHNRIDGLLTPDEIKTFRKTVGITQADAAHIFGGGPMAFSKYERGEAAHSRALDILMRLILAGEISLDSVRQVEPGHRQSA